MNRDLVVGIVGAAILVSAMVGVFYYEKNNVAATGAGAGTFANATGPEESGTTAVGASTVKTLSINTTNLVNVTLTLKWTAASGKDTMKLTVQPPAPVPEGNVSASDSGTIEVTIPVPQNATGSVGVGDWKVTVQFVSASAGTPVTPPVTPPVGTDASVSWTLTSTLRSRA